MCWCKWQVKRCSVWWLGRKRVEARREDIKWVTPSVFETIKCVSLSPLSVSFHLCPLHPPTLPSTFQNYFPLSVPPVPPLHSPSLPPSLSSAVCSLHYMFSSLLEQTGLLSFTAGPEPEGWQTHKGSASLTRGLQRKLKEGIVGTWRASALHQLWHAGPQKKNECVQNEFTYVAHTKQWYMPTFICANLSSLFSSSHWRSFICRQTTETIRNEAPVNWVTEPIYVALHCLAFVACSSLPYGSRDLFLND